MKKTALTTALAVILGSTALTAQAITLFPDDVLVFDDGVASYDSNSNLTNVTSGSFFGMDLSSNSKISGAEKTPIIGINGIKIGSTQSPNDIDKWFFNSAWGTHWTDTVPIDDIGGDITNGLDFSGWTVNWNGVNPPMTNQAWLPLNCSKLGNGATGLAGEGCDGQTFADGVANFEWNGTYGTGFELWYTATVPAGDASGFGGTQYFAYLTGTVQEASVVPVPAAVWLFGSGLVGLVGVARRKKSA